MLPTPSSKLLEEAIFNKANPIDTLSLEVFAYQHTHNAVYREFAERLGRTPDTVLQAEQIPFLPVEFFKTHTVIAAAANAASELIFRSSGTTAATQAAHRVLRAALYEKAYLAGFERQYGKPQDYRILALLPGYLERSDSSLVHMVQGLIGKSGHTEGGFFLDDFRSLHQLLQKPCERHTLLIGVSFALLDFAEAHPMALQNTTVMETGGMKGRRRELTRHELHEALKKHLGVDAIHSEYGMTELLSQAYAKKDGRFETPPWMALRIRDANDPLSPAESGRTGGINVIDLANLYSCSFIATSDLGRALPDGSTEILGRMDFSDLRGCNLMVGDY